MVSAINLGATAADDSVLGYAFFAETKACAASAAACIGHKQQLVRRKPGE